MEKTVSSQPDYKALLSKAQTYCASAEHCTSEVRTKLIQWSRTCTKGDDDCADSLSEDDLNCILSSLIEDRYIDDLRYATAFVNDKVRFAGWGRIKIRAGLYAKRIDESIIDQALATIDEDDYKKALDKALRQKRGTTEQIMRFLLSRGFIYDEIKERLP